VAEGRVRGHEITRTFYERENPTPPRSVGMQCRKLLLIKIDFARFDLRYSARLKKIEKPPRPIDGQNPAGWPDDIGHVDGGVTRAAADIEECLPDRESGSPPGVERPRSPHAMLKSEALDFVVVRAENIVTVVGCGHTAITR